MNDHPIDDPREQVAIASPSSFTVKLELELDIHGCPAPPSSLPLPCRSYCCSRLHFPHPNDQLYYFDCKQPKQPLSFISSTTMATVRPVEQASTTRSCLSVFFVENTVLMPLTGFTPMELTWERCWLLLQKTLVPQVREKKWTTMVVPLLTKKVVKLAQQCFHEEEGRDCWASYPAWRCHNRQTCLQRVVCFILEIET